MREPHVLPGEVSPKLQVQAEHQHHRDQRSGEDIKSQPGPPISPLNSGHISPTLVATAKPMMYDTILEDAIGPKTIRDPNNHQRQARTINLPNQLPREEYARVMPASHTFPRASKEESQSEMVVEVNSPIRVERKNFDQLTVNGHGRKGEREKYDTQSSERGVYYGFGGFDYLSPGCIHSNVFTAHFLR